VAAKKKAGKKPAGGCRGPKWTALEDECLAEAWKVVRIDPFIGANQNCETYWRRVKVAYDERRQLDPDFKSLRNERGDSGMSHRWGIIQHACNKWHGIQEEIRRHPESGTNVGDQVSYTRRSSIALLCPYC